MGPLDVILNQLGGESAIAEITEREFRLMRNERETGNNAESARSSFLFQSRGESEDEIYEKNQVEWNAFTAGKKRIALISAAVGIEFQLSSSEPVMVLYCGMHSMLPDISLFSSPCPITLHVFYNDVNVLALNRLLSQLKQEGATVKERFEKVTESAVEKAMELWYVFLKTGKLPIPCGTYMKRDEGDQEICRRYLEGNQEFRVECVLSQVRGIGLSNLERQMSLDQVLSRIVGSSIFCRRLVVGVLQDLVKFGSELEKKQLDWESGVSVVKGKT